MRVQPQSFAHIDLGHVGKIVSRIGIKDIDALGGDHIEIMAVRLDAVRLVNTLHLHVGIGVPNVVS